MSIYRPAVFLLACVLSACGEPKTTIPPAQFVDASEGSGLDVIHKSYPIGELIAKNEKILLAGGNVALMLSGGVAAGDLNQDGLVDLYFVGGYQNTNRLYKNLGNGQFEDVSADSGLNFDSTNSNGPLFADFNGDGMLDLFLGGVDLQEEKDIAMRRKMNFKHEAPPRIFINTGDFRFKEETAKRGVYANTNTFSSTLGDVDLDGDLDLFTTHWGPLSSRNVQHLWKNNGSGFFYGADYESKLASSFTDIDRTMAPHFSDINGDGYPDILLTGDFETSQVFMNNGNGQFSNKTNPFEINDENGMGAAVGDYDNDGDMDWFVTSVRDDNPVQQTIYKWGTTGNRLYQNQGDGRFKNVTEEAGVRDGYWGWGSCFADFNQDGFLDIFHVNGYGNPEESIWAQHKAQSFFEDPSRLFINQRNGSFEEQSQLSGIDDRGNGRGVICSDLDMDGDIDIVISNYDQPPRLFLNKACDDGKCSYLKVKLKGQKGNTDALGAKVKLIGSALTQHREVNIGSNYLSNNPAEIYFYGENSFKGAQLEIVWPDSNRTQTNTVVKTNSGLMVVEHPEIKSPKNKPKSLHARAEEAFQKGIATLLDHPTKEDVVWALTKIQELVPEPEIAAYIKSMHQYHRGSELEWLMGPKLQRQPKYNEQAKGVFIFQNYLNAPFFKDDSLSFGLLREFLSEDQGGYILTHQLLALFWATEQKQSLPEDLLARRKPLLDRLLEEQQEDKVFHDLAAERMAILFYYDYQSLSSKEVDSWIETVLFTQLQNGQWEGASYQNYSNFYGTENVTPPPGLEPGQRDHTTVLNLLALAVYLKKHADL